MAKTRMLPASLANYPYHLPDKPPQSGRTARLAIERVLKTISGPAYEAYLARQLQSEEEL